MTFIRSHEPIRFPLLGEQPVRRLVMVALLGAGMTLSSCSTESSSAGPDDDTDTADDLRTAIAEAHDARMVVEETSARLLVDCMTDAGFDIHPPDLVDGFGWDKDEWTDMLVPPEAPSGFLLPTVEEVEAEGLGETHRNSRGSVSRHEDEADPYYEMPEEYRRDYEEARYGQEYADYLAVNGSMIIEGEKWPLVGGCQLTVDETLWGSQADYAHDEEALYYSPQPSEPSVFDPAVQTEQFFVAMIDDYDAWSDCLTDRGHPGLEVHRVYGHRLWLYVEYFYEDGYAWTHSGSSKAPDEAEDPYVGLEPPEGAPWDDETASQRERELGIDAATCADELDLRQTTEQTWTATLAELSIEYEVEIYEWTQAYQTALVNAQNAQ